MTKYEPLTAYLDLCKKQSIKLTYIEIEKLLGFNLPASASKHSAWWSNNVERHTHAVSWRAAGYKTSDLVLGESVVFIKE